MSASSKATTQTNDNEAALARQQQQTQAQLITAQQTNNALINADLGTANHVPAPTGIPSVSAVMGPGESSLLRSLTLTNLATAETQASAAVDPNETGILATFANSASSTQAGLSANSAATLESIATGSAASQLSMAQEAGGGGQGIANPLGPQVTSVPSYADPTSSAAPAANGVSPVVIIAIVAAGGGALWWFESRRAA